MASSRSCLHLNRSHRRTGQHPFGGADRVLPEWIRWGGGVVADIFRDPYSVGCLNLFPLTPVTGPKFVLFKQVLCFTRIMSTLCPNSCRQTARIGGGQLPPCPIGCVSSTTTYRSYNNMYCMYDCYHAHSNY